MTQIFGIAGPWATMYGSATPRQSFPVNLDVTEIGPAGGLVAAPHTKRAGNLIVAIHGRPVWSRAGEYTRDGADCAGILAAYKARGASLLEELRGRFALVIVDGERRRILLAVDPMGIERLCWATSGDSIVFGGSAEAVADFPPVRAVFRPQGVYDFLLMHMIPAPDTVYEGVSKLEPGTKLLFEDGRVALTKYWVPQFNELRAESPDELHEELRNELYAAVQRCEPDMQTGAFLSGGLDSSTVSGMLGIVSGRRPRTFSIGFGVESHDETRYSRISARHFGCDATEYHVTPENIVSTFDQIAAAYDEPFGNSSAVPTLFCAQLAAKAGISHMLAGDGGDELFGGNERYAKQQIFESYARLPAWVRLRILEPVSQHIGDENPIAPLRKMRSFINQARIPLPERLESWNLIYRTPHTEIFEPDFAAQIEARRPIDAMARVFNTVPEGTLLNRMLHYDWHFTLADSDLRKVVTMCDLAGVQVSFPMLDPGLIDLSLRVPTIMKMDGRELRSFYKRAMAGFLPREIIDKQKHGFGLPFGVWLKEHAGLRELIFGHLQRLGQRGIIRPAFLDRIALEHRSGEPGYYGYAIWDFAMLESWLAAHRPRGI
ncbi:MAG: Asparagine synthetase [glutamine-hydrolyzing] 1 [Steroidobacteraceae bacterium]|nr:Asparagine synthetase [glutamine-hydrolyzing] 1 [Steroidobacteraceae bacterium]